MRRRGEEVRIPSVTIPGTTVSTAPLPGQGHLQPPTPGQYMFGGGNASREAIFEEAPGGRVWPGFLPWLHGGVVEGGGHHHHTPQLLPSCGIEA